MGGSEELRAKLKWVESDLAVAQKVAVDGAEAVRQAKGERKMTRAQASQLREERKAVEAKCKDAEQENGRLKKELEELRVGFAAQKKELEDEYQKQVDDMFFFGYQCCIKKNDITQDTPSYPSDDEDATLNSSA